MQMPGKLLQRTSQRSYKSMVKVLGDTNLWEEFSIAINSRFMKRPQKSSAELMVVVTLILSRRILEDQQPESPSSVKKLTVMHP